jgi:transposase
MSFRRYKTGLNRQQAMLMPPSVDDYVSEINTVRAIEAYVNSLDLAALNFKYTDEGSVLGGGPAYHPSVMLKLYLYGYMNRIRSSRRLEREARRNIELMWLLEGFKPSHTAIANFRKDNLKALKKTNSDFVQLCRELNLYGGEEVGIDGTFMNGNASKASIHTQDKLEKQLEQLDKSINEYMAALEQNDQSERDVKTEDTELPEKLVRLKERQNQVKARLEKIEQSGGTQVSETDPDARLLKKRGQVVAGYNVQIAVDSKNKLIVCHDVVNEGNDSQQLAPMAQKAKETLDVDNLVVDADKGYENHQQIKACEDANITPYVPLADKAAQTRNQGRFTHDQFTYDETTDCYQCPAEQTLNFQGIQNKNGKIQFKYASKASTCKDCKLKQQCLPQKTPHKSLYRWEHQSVIDKHRTRMELNGREHMKNRSGMAEHPFGIMKIQMGWLHFLMRGLDKVKAEMDLQMFSYNFQRVLKLVGIDAFKNHLKQRIVA